MAHATQHGLHAFFPAFSKGTGSQLLKSAVALSIVLYPAFVATESHLYNYGQAPSLTFVSLLGEIFLGTILGLTISLPYHAFAALGGLVDVYRGATFSAQATGGEAGEHLPLEDLFGYIYTAIILAGPGLHAITIHLLSSYLLFPPGQIDILAFNSWNMHLIRMVSDYLVFGVLMSAPILIAVMLIEAVVSITAVFAQQLQVYSIQFGLKSFFGILALLIYMEFAADEMINLFRVYGETTQTLLQGVQ
ncbi:MAG: flagellar biosynthetic protein FliR [Limnobacter sp.]|nr:flagellar biosynthetic protein FliR [Limnobacter sp.]